MLVWLAAGFGGADQPSGSKPVDISVALPDLIVCTHDSDQAVRGSAAFAIEKIGPKARTAVPDLTRLLNDANEHTRSFSASALGAIGSDAHAAVPILQSLMHDSSEEVRSSAREALSKILKNREKAK